LIRTTLDQHRRHPPGDVRWDRKANACVRLRTPRRDLCIDADDLPFQVKQWAARIAGIDRRIGLDGLGNAKGPVRRGDRPTSLGSPARAAVYAIPASRQAQRQCPDRIADNRVQRPTQPIA
jgi:hypothetical protein